MKNLPPGAAIVIVLSQRFVVGECGRGEEVVAEEESAVEKISMKPFSAQCYICTRKCWSLLAGSLTA